MIPQIKFIFDRQRRAGKGKMGSVELRITYNYKQKYIATGVRCFPGEWDAKVECVKSLESHELNAVLLKIRTKVMKIISDMVESESIDIEAIPPLLKNKVADMTLTDYIYKRMQDRQVSDYTKRAYQVFFNRFFMWGGMKYFSQVTVKGIREFDEYLHAFRWTGKDRQGRDVTRQYAQATIGAMHKNLKSFIADAVVDGYLKENPYVSKRIKIDKGGTRIDRFLTAEEVWAVEGAKLPTRALDESRDLFLVQVFSGLSFVDLMTYDFTQCRNANDYAVFSGLRSKTKVMFSFVLTPKTKAILERYGYRLPKLPNQKYNMRIKLIMDAAGIDRPVSSHDARRSCGSILLNAGVPISVVSRILGHSSIRQTEQAYARLLDDTIAEEIRKHVK